MKLSLVTLLFSLSSLFITLEAQNPAYPYGLSYKALFMDYQSQNGGGITEFSNYHYGFEVGLHKNLNQNLNLVVPVKAGVVTSHISDAEGCFHKKVYGADAQIQYMFYRPETKVTPYVMAGAGGVIEDEGEFNVQIPFGAGLNFQVRENAYINWQSEFRYSLSEDRNNLHHGIGFVYLFGAKKDMPMKEMEEKVMDSDGDGLEDDIDLCPQQAGPIDLKGCPDTDSDGIPDYRDSCPDVVGVAIFKGCPDTDGDGVSDNEDECPNKAGTVENKGCPASKDSDGDGIPDDMDKCPQISGTGADGCPKKESELDSDGDGVPNSQDKCPNQAGFKSYSGCPDTDGDGIDDSRDKCPSTPGPVSTNGCPEISKTDRSVLDLAMRAVQFDTGRSTLKNDSYSVLDQIAGILNRYPNYKLIIEGHTDNVGSAINNQMLSEKRAKACFDVLTSKGVSSSRMSHTGYGESRPISSNDTLEGRKLNRRVVFNLVPR